MLEDELRMETEKWLAKIEKREPMLLDKGKKEMLENVYAYVSDTKHFLGKGDLMRAFEAVIWAWAWLEIMEELKVIKTEKTR